MAQTLIVTDSRPLAKRLTALMIDAGRDAVLANNQEEGLMLYRQHKPALAIVDVCMADIPGLELGQTFLFEKTDTRLIMMSDIDTRRLRDQALRCGARDVLIKPFSDAEFMFTVKKYLEDFDVEAD